MINVNDKITCSDRRDLMKMVKILLKNGYDVETDGCMIMIKKIPEDEQ